MEYSNTLIIFLLIFLVIGIDIYARGYKYTSKLVNYLLIFLMAVGHPLYFGISFNIAFLIEINIFHHSMNNQFSYLGYFILFFSTFIFTLLRYKIYTFIWKKDIKNINNLYEYSKFYIFTFPGIFLYLSVIDKPLEFYFVYMNQLILPFSIGIVLLYTLFKILILKFINWKKQY
jgi:hypothetical protein